MNTIYCTLDGIMTMCNMAVISNDSQIHNTPTELEFFVLLFVLQLFL